MQGNLKIRATDRFKRDFKRLPVDLQMQTEECLLAFSEDPLPESRRPHRVNSTRPKVFSLDVTSNKSHKVTFMIEGGVAILLRVATHKEIDRSV